MVMEGEKKEILTKIDDTQRQPLNNKIYFDLNLNMNPNKQLINSMKMPQTTKNFINRNEDKSNAPQKSLLDYLMIKGV